MSKLHTMLAALALIPCASGCVFLELNGSYYTVSYSPPDGVPEPADEPKGGWAIGLGLGAYLEVERTVRIAPGIGFEYIPLKDSGDGKGSTTRSAPGGQLDVSVMEVGDDSMLRASLAVLVGDSKYKYTPPGGSESSFDGKTLSVFAGATYAWFEDDEDTFQLSLGPHYVRNKGDEFGTVTAIGPQLKFTISANLAGGGGGSGSSDSGDDGDLPGIKFELPKDENVVPALAQGARKYGCSVNEKSDGLIAKCDEGNIVYVQKGRTVLAICQKGMTTSSCRSLHRSILDEAIH